MATVLCKRPDRGVFAFFQNVPAGLGEQGRLQSLVKDKQGSRLGTEFVNHRATKSLDVFRQQQERREEKKQRKLELAQRKVLWYALQDTQPGITKKDLEALETYQSNRLGRNERWLPRLQIRQLGARGTSQALDLMDLIGMILERPQEGQAKYGTMGSSEGLQGSTQCMYEDFWMRRVLGKGFEHV